LCSRRYCFESNNGSNKRCEKQQSQAGGGFFKNQNTDNGRPGSTDARPYSVGRTDGQIFNGLHQQPNTDGQRDEESDIPPYFFLAHSVSGLAETKGKCYFK